MIAALLLACAPAVWAQPAPAAPAALDDITDWTLEEPPKPGQQPTSAEGSFSQAENIRFGEQMRRNVFEQICRAIELPIEGGFSKEGVGIHGGIHRSIRILPDQRLALVEEAGVRLDLGHQLVSAAEAGAIFGISISAHVDGRSMVVRPLPTRNSCKEIKEVLKFWTEKTVLPLTPRRIMAMQVGELWKVPAGLSIGHAESVADPLNPYVTVSISFGTGQSGTSMVTLYRVTENRLRLRLRVDHARIHNKSGQITEIFPAIEVFAPGGGLVLKALEHAADALIAREVSHFMSAMFGIYSQRVEGQQLLMEFILDPTNEQEMETLAKVLKGDFKTGVEMALRTATLQATPERTRADFERLEQEHERDFGKTAAYPALDIYHTATKRLALALPFIVSHSRSKTEADDQIIQLSAEGGQWRIFRDEKTSETGNFNIPIKGTLVKHNMFRSAQSFVFESRDGRVTDPQAVYIQQEGFLRKDSQDFRRSVEQINDVMSLAGARGGSRNPRLTVPVDQMIPPPAPPTRDPFTDEERTQSRTYGQGSIQWTLVFTERAVAQILEAADELIVRCFINSLESIDDQRLMSWLTSHAGWLGLDGKLNVDWRVFSRDFGDDDNSSWSRGRLGEICKTATALLMDVATVRRAPTKAAQADAMSMLLSGRGESGLEYQEILRVLVQLVDPLNLTSDLNININKRRKEEKDAHSHYVLRRDRPENPQLKRAGDAKTRFARPSDLVD